MGVFHVFKIVYMVPNRAKHHICYLKTKKIERLSILVKLTQKRNTVVLES